MLPFVPLHSKCILLSIQVLFYEMRGIKKACTELEKSYKPKITFIVTVKRHHGRFAVVNQRNKVDCSLSFIFLFVYCENNLRQLSQVLLCFCRITITSGNHAEEEIATKKNLKVIIRGGKI